MADKDAPPAAPSAVRGASLLIALQVASRAATFIANQLLLRFLTAQLLGVATQLEVYYLSVLFFARESLRVAIQRQGGREQSTPNSSDEDSKKDSKKDTKKDSKKDSKTAKGSASPSSSSSQSAVNLAYVSILLGALVALLLGWLYLASIQKTTADDSYDHKSTSSLVATTPFLVPGLYLYAVASAVELLSEPAFVVLQLRLQFGARAAAESVATVLRCATTLGAALLAARSGLDIGVLPFALGQLAYGFGLLAVYAWYGTALARREGFSLLPRRLKAIGKDGQGKNDYALQLFDRPTLHLASSMSVQSIVKHVLTQGDTFLVSVLSTTTAQGVYALANNYGGLAARLLFQPIEESSRSYFSRLLAGGSTEKGEPDKEEEIRGSAGGAARDLQTLLKLYLLFSLVVTALGPAAAAPFLGLVTGPRWAASGAAATLAAYMWYIPLLAVNGVAEAFVASVATEAQVYRQSVWMGAFSVVFAGAGYVCLRVLDGGAVGLVAANCINMVCRIVWCLVFIRQYFAARGVGFYADAAKTLAPHPLAVLAAVVTSGAVQRLVVVPAAAGLAATGPLAQITQLVKIAVLAVPFLLTIAFVERKFFWQCYGFARGGGRAN